jgi:hypothetical protein
MSLLADLLSKLKPPQTTRDIPPNLRSIVQSSAQKSANRRRVFLLSVLFVVAVLAGFFLVHFINMLSKKPAGTVSAAPERTVVASNQTQTTTPDVTDKREKPSTAPVEAGLKSAPASGQKEEPASPVQLPEPARKFVRGGGSVLPDLEQVIVRKDAPVAQSAAKDESAQDAYLYSARDLELKNDYPGALGYYKKVLGLDHHNFTVMNNIAYLYLKMALPEEAATYARMALEIKGNYVPALINLGIASAVSGDIPNAEESFIHALKREPDNRDALFNLALLYEKKTDYPKASEYFAKLSSLGSVTGTLGLARIFEKQDNPGEALKLYRSAYSDLSLDDETRARVKQRIVVLLNNMQTKETKTGN